MNHSFDIEHAKKYGVPQAIILNNVLFWLAHNKAFNINIHDGKPWTFNSVAAYARLFPYWTQDKIRRYFESLEEDGVLISGNFNKKKYDKTKWHTVADQSLIPVTPDPLANSPKAKMPDGNGESAKPIPDINTDENISMLPKLKESKPIKNKAKPKVEIIIHPEVLDVLNFIKDCSKQDLIKSKSAIEHIKSLLIPYSKDQIFKAYSYFAIDNFWIENDLPFAAFVKQFEKYHIKATAKAETFKPQEDRFAMNEDLAKEMATALSNPA